MSHPSLKMSSDEMKLWNDIQTLRVVDPSRDGQVIGFFWNKAVTACHNGDLVSSIILAGITAELAHRTKLRKQNVETYWKNGKPKSWEYLIKNHEESKETQKIAIEIKDQHRNMWVHPDIEKIEKYLKSEGLLITTDVGLNIGCASTNALKVLGSTAQLLKMLDYAQKTTA